jgi:hypothetical protein
MFSVEMSESTLSCSAFNRAHVIDPLGGLLGLGVVSVFIGATSALVKREEDKMVRQ